MPPTVRIGSKTVLHSGLLILDDDEPAFIEIRLPLGAPIATDIVKIEFRCPPSLNAVTDFSWSTIGDVVRFELSGMKANLWGLALPEPVQFGLQSGRPLYCQFVYSRVAEKNVVQLLVLQGDLKP